MQLIQVLSDSTCIMKGLTFPKSLALFFCSCIDMNFLDMFTTSGLGVDKCRSWDRWDEWGVKCSITWRFPCLKQAGRVCLLTFHWQKRELGRIMVGGISNQIKIINHIRQTYQTDLRGYCFSEHLLSTHVVVFVRVCLRVCRYIDASPDR